MRLIELYAEEFGLFEHRSFTFGEGLNVIEGENESGKSTIEALIRFLFYGFPRRGGEEGDERYKRVSRKTHRAAGSVIFSTADGEYVLFREYILHTTGGREVPVEKVRATKRDGTPVALAGKSAGECFLGLPAQLYQSSVCVRQSEIDAVAAPNTGDLVGEMLFSGEGGARLDNAKKILDDVRRSLQHNRGRGGRIAELEDEATRIDEALLDATDAAQRLRELRTAASHLSVQAQDKARELKRVEEMLRAARLDAQLARYDAWHQAKKAEEDALVAFQKCEDTGVVNAPPTEFISKAREILHRHAIAMSNVALRGSELELARREAQRHPRGAAARYVKENGGDTEIAYRAAEYAAKKRNNTIFATVLFVLALSLAVGGVFLPVLFAAGAVSLVLAVVFLLRRRRTAGEESAFYQRMGLSSPAMLRAFLAQYAREERTRADAAAALESSEQLYADAVLREENVFSELRAAFEAVGAIQNCTSHVTAEEYLTLLSNCATAVQNAFLEERLRYENAKSARTALENGLDPQREAELRAARAHLITPTADIAELERRLAFLRETARGIEEKRNATAREESALMAVFTDPAVLKERKEEVAGALFEARERLLAIKMASEALLEADEELRSGVMPALAKEASVIFGRLTHGTHQTLCVDDRFGVFVKTPEGDFPLSHFSTGCRDAAYFSLRVGLISLITKEPLPLLLDEVAAHLDDTRARELLSLLGEMCRGGAQCLLFTCHTREARLLAGEDFTHVTL